MESGPSEEPLGEASKMLAQQFMMQTDCDFSPRFRMGKPYYPRWNPTGPDHTHSRSTKSGRLAQFLCNGMDFLLRAVDGYLRLIVASTIRGQDRLGNCGPLRQPLCRFARFAAGFSCLRFAIAAFVAGAILSVDAGA